MNHHTTKLPLSKRTLRQRIDTLSNSLPGIDTSALGPVFTGTPGQSDLVWAIQLLDGLSSQLTLTLFKQYMRRRKDGTSRNCRSANIWLRERTKWVRGLIQAIPVDPQAMRDEKRGASVSPTCSPTRRPRSGATSNRVSKPARSRICC